jgi:hypothetical protein
MPRYAFVPPRPDYPAASVAYLSSAALTVVISAAEFERFEALQDACWGRLAEEAEKEGYLGVDESERLLKSYLHAED